MKTLITRYGIIGLALVIGLSITACPSPTGGPGGPNSDPNSGPSSGAASVTYESKAGEDVYVLVITQNQNTGRAADSANTGLAFTLKYYPSSTETKKATATSGRVITNTRDRIVLETTPTATVNVTITIIVTLNSEDKMIALNWEGKITWDDNQQTDAPTTLEHLS